MARRKWLLIGKVLVVRIDVVNGSLDKREIRLRNKIDISVS